MGNRFLEGQDWKYEDEIGSYCNSETRLEGIDDRLMNWILEVRTRRKKDGA